MSEDKKVLQFDRSRRNPQKVAKTVQPPTERLEGTREAGISEADVAKARAAILRHGLDIPWIARYGRGAKRIAALRLVAEPAEGDPKRAGALIALAFVRAEKQTGPKWPRTSPSRSKQDE